MGRGVRDQTQRHNPGSLAEWGNSFSIGFNRTGPPEDWMSVNITHPASLIRGRSYIQSRSSVGQKKKWTWIRQAEGSGRVFTAQLEVETVQLFQLLLNTVFSARSLTETASLSQAVTTKDFRFVTNFYTF